MLHRPIQSSPFLKCFSLSYKPYYFGNTLGNQNYLLTTDSLQYMRMSVDLFVRTDGKPMVFLMNYVIEREDVRRAVEERGGVLVEDISPSICDNVIRLLARTEMAISRNYDMFYYHYIMDCIEADTPTPTVQIQSMH